MQIGQVLGIGVWEVDWTAEMPSVWLFRKVYFFGVFRILDLYAVNKKKCNYDFFFVPFEFISRNSVVYISQSRLFFAHKTNSTR